MLVSTSAIIVFDAQVVPNLASELPSKLCPFTHLHQPLNTSLIWDEKIFQTSLYFVSDIKSTTLQGS